jgi:hypothetical protein
MPIIRPYKLLICFQESTTRDRIYQLAYDQLVYLQRFTCIKIGLEPSPNETMPTIVFASHVTCRRKTCQI